MWSKVVDFFKSNKCVIWWTIGYFIATWAIMKYMFDFDIFSALRWHQLAHAHLRGFPGMVFGILILAAVPMYIATTVVIARTKAPLFSIKIPESVKTFFINAFIQTPLEEPVAEQPEPVTQEAEPEQAPSEPDIEKPIPDAVPSELRVAYMRAREHIGHTPTSVFDLGHMTKSASDPEPQGVEQPDEIPIPSDFDIEDVDDMIDSVPQFTDINFDDDDDDETPIEIDDVHTESETTKPITEFLKSQSVPYEIVGDVVVTDKFAIVAHTEPDFWVADTESWFAAGKTRPSPIVAVKHAADTQHVQPVLYLGSDNIMDIDSLRNTWTSDGIRIITDLKDLI